MKYENLNKSKGVKMEKKYREIQLMPGCSIEEAINELKSQTNLVCASFNGHILYSDADDIDSAYRKITGKSKTEYNEIAQENLDRYEAEKKNHEESIPKLTEEWIKKGNEVLDKKYHKLWAKIVPIRLKDLYRGMELGACLDIVKQLNIGCNLDVAKNIIEKQGHSGMSFYLVCSMVKSFCDRGTDFVNYIK